MAIHGARLVDRWTLVVLLATVPGCQEIDHWRARTDFMEVCAAVTAFSRSPNESPAAAQTRLAASIADVLDSNAARQAFAATAAAEPGVRYQLIRQAAVDVGIENFSCPALEAMFKPPVLPAP